MTVLSLSLLLGAAAAFSPPPPSMGGLPASRRAFHDTKWGQLHYVRGGNPHANTTLLLFHSDPRCSSEFKYLLQELAPSYGYLAIDFYGMGHSDDPACSDAPGDGQLCIDTAAFAQAAIDVVDAEGVTSFALYGNLKGAYVAQYLAANPRFAPRVSALILTLPLYVYPENRTNLEQYIRRGATPQLKADGSHLVTVWNDASANPVGFLAKEEERTVDELRSLFTHWRYQLLMVDYAPAMLQGLRDTKAPVLLIWGDAALDEWDLYGLRAHQQVPLVEDALTSREGVDTVVKHVANGYQGLVAANSTLVASWVSEFLGARRGTVPTPGMLSDLHLYA